MRGRVLVGVASKRRHSFQLLISARKFRPSLRIIVPGPSNADLPWPDTICQYGFYSWHEVHSPAAYRHSTRITTKGTSDRELLCVPHFAIEYRVAGKRSFNYQVPFVMGKALEQAMDFGLDPEEYAAYGATIDLEQGDINLYGMTTQEVCPIYLNYS